jgi:hypothetical protein
MRHGLLVGLGRTVPVAVLLGDLRPVQQGQEPLAERGIPGACRLIHAVATISDSDPCCRSCSFWILSGFAEKILKKLGRSR